MKKIRIARLKARLSHYLRLVRRGQSITVCDRDTPIARLVPFPKAPSRPRLRIIQAKRPFADFWKVPIPPVEDIGIDVVELLREERRERLDPLP